MLSKRAKLVFGVLPLAVVVTLFCRWDPSRPELIKSAPQVVPGAVAELSASEILAKMAAVYAACSSYQDEGVVRDEFGGFFGHESSRPFATSFVRGGGFRFEYRKEGAQSLASRALDTHDRRVIWGNERRARRWTSRGRTSELSLDAQLSGEAGVSGLASKTVPRLLLPDLLGGRRIDQLADPIVVAIEAFDGRNCYRVEGGSPGSRETLWIDAQSFLLRRMQDSDDPECVSTTAYSPRLNVEIDPAVFAFEPPG